MTHKLAQSRFTEVVLLIALGLSIVAIVCVAIFVGVDATEKTGLRYLVVLLGGALVGKKFLSKNGDDENGEEEEPVKSRRRRRTR